MRLNAFWMNANVPTKSELNLSLLSGCVHRSPRNRSWIGLLLLLKLLFWRKVSPRSGWIHRISLQSCELSDRNDLWIVGIHHWIGKVHRLENGSISPSDPLVIVAGVVPTCIHFTFCKTLILDLRFKNGHFTKPGVIDLLSLQF